MQHMQWQRKQASQSKGDHMEQSKIKKIKRRETLTLRQEGNGMKVSKGQSDTLLEL